MKLIAIDGNSLMHRAYYALPGMTSKDGTPTGALHGFLSMLMKLVEMRPDYLVVGFDMPVKTFRHEKYAEYKAGRRETPDDLRTQFPLIKQVLAGMKVPVVECERYEADDILGTFSRLAAESGVESLLVTGDRDALQLVSDTAHVLMTKKGITETVEYDEARLREEYGLEPSRMVDLKGLMGDSSDNLPGIKGVGEKTALKLLAKYGSLENVLENVQNEKGALREKLINGVDTAKLSYELGTINTYAPIDRGIESCAFSPSGMANAIPLLTKLELRAITKRVRELSGLGKADNDGGEIHEKDGGTTNIIKVDSHDELMKICTDHANARYFAAEITEDEVSFAFSESGECSGMYFLKLGGTLLEPGFTPEEVLDCLKPLFENEKIDKWLFDAKNVMTLLNRYGISCSGIEFDAMIADYLLNAIHPANDLSTLAQECGVEDTGAAAIVKLRCILADKLEKENMTELYEKVELPLISVLFDMERTGFKTDRQILTSLGGDMDARAKMLAEQIYELADEEFNILSPKQLSGILFDKLGLPAKRKTKTGYSTDSDVLESLKGFHPIIEKIIEYRFLTKLKSTFIDAMLEKTGSDGRIHTTFNQNVTATGRISSQKPNLQNIPVREELGREIRKAFVASDGNCLVGADYSQIELRVLAHISGDEALIRAFTEGDDIHTRTAAEVFSVDKSEVTPQMRSAAKAVNFGIVYGISAYGLSEQLGISPKRASEYIEKYLDRCTGVKQFMHDAVEKGRNNGYAETIMGRRRALPEIASSNYNTRSFGERVAMNMPIQGSAADIIKLAMVNVHRRLREEGLKAKLVLQVHDELLIDSPMDEVESVSKLLHECMCGAVTLKVPLVAEVNIGRSWFETK